MNDEIAKLRIEEAAKLEGLIEKVRLLVAKVPSHADKAKLVDAVLMAGNIAHDLAWKLDNDHKRSLSGDD